MTFAPFDLLPRGGHLVDPSTGWDGPADIGIKVGKVAAVQESPQAAAARETIDVRGSLVIPGMIDTHAHIYIPACPAASASRPTWWASRAASPSDRSEWRPVHDLPRLPKICRRADRLLMPLFCLRSGKRFDAAASILPQAEAA